MTRDRDRVSAAFVRASGESDDRDYEDDDMSTDQSKMNLKIERKDEEEEERVFIPDEEIYRSSKRERGDGIAGATLAENGQRVDRRLFVEPPQNHGVFLGARLPRDERVVDSANLNQKSPQFIDETERFRTIDLAEEQKRERKELRAKRDALDNARRARNAEREQEKLRREELAIEKEEERAEFKRSHVGNRPNTTSVPYDPVNMEIKDDKVRDQDAKELKKMLARRALTEKRTYGESFDIVTHLERVNINSSSCVL